MNVNTRWVSFVRPGHSAHPKCWCYTRVEEPDLSTGGGPVRDAIGIQNIFKTQNICFDKTDVKIN